MIEHHTDAHGEQDAHDTPDAQDKRAGEPYSPAMAAFVERFAGDLVEAGMQRMASRVFACLLVSHDSALSAAELARRLQASPAAISGAVRYLAQVHMLSRERQPGSRRELYRLHNEVWYEALTRRDAVVGRWLLTLRDGVEVVGKDSPAGERLTETAEFLAYLLEELDGILERWHERRADLRRS